MKRTLRCRSMITPDGPVADGEIQIEDELITAVRPASPADHDRAEIETIEGVVLPGFVDTHTHGCGGHDLATDDVDEARAAVAFARRFGGTTSLIASLVTAPLETLEAQLRTLGPLVDAGEIAGIHAEGPFLSEAKRGAHTPELLRDPDPASVDRLLTAADGRLSMITIAPERPGAIAAIERFVAAGVTVAVGHTDGDDPITERALDAGASVATHLFNAMPSIHHRDPGPIPRLLTDQRVLVELICDGVHVAPQVLTMAIEAAGVDRVAMITDAMVATGMPDGSYSLGGLQVAVSGGVARLRTTDGSQGSIAGSTLTMRAAFAYGVQQLGLSIEEVSTMTAATPARRHGLTDMGRLEAGYRADLAVVDDQGNLLRLMHRGVWEELA